MILCEQKFNWIIIFFYVFFLFSLVLFDYFHHIVSWTFVGFVGCFFLLWKLFSSSFFLQYNWKCIISMSPDADSLACQFGVCCVCVCLRCFLQIDLLVPVFFEQLKRSHAGALSKCACCYYEILIHILLVFMLCIRFEWKLL